MTRALIRQVGLASAILVALAGCQAGKGPLAGLGKSAGADDAPVTDATTTAETSVRVVDRDVETPAVFQVTADALWDGRPSLGGVWVASVDAKDPERVIIRNPANGKFVVGALFRRERDNPGPELQISSDAAAALGLLAGEPGKISVTALRREEEPAAPDATQPILDAAETVETSELDPVAGAAAAIDRADGMPVTAPADDVAASADPAVAKTGKRVPKMDASAITPEAVAPATTSVAAVKSDPAPVPKSEGSRIQIGIFSVEENAQRAVDALAKAGITASIRKEQSQGKPLWSVTTRGDKATLAKIKSAGFGDAYVLKG